MIGRRNETPEKHRFEKSQSLVCGVFFITAVLTLVFFFGFCRIRTVRIEGVRYSSEERIEASADIRSGMHQYAIDKGKIESRICAENPFVSSVEIRRSLPGVLRLIVTEYDPAYLLPTDSSRAVLSKDLRVLRIFGKAETVPPLPGTALLYLPGTPKIILGSELQWEEDPPEDYVFRSLSLLSDCEAFGSFTEIDLRKKYEIKAVCKDRYTIIFGSPSLLQKNLALCMNSIYTVESNRDYTDVNAVLYALSENEVIFSPEP